MHIIYSAWLFWLQANKPDRICCLILMHSIIGSVLCFSEFHTENPETSDFPLVQMLTPVRPGGVFNLGFPLFVMLFFWRRISTF